METHYANTKTESADRWFVFPRLVRSETSLAYSMGMRTRSLGDPRPGLRTYGPRAQNGVRERLPCHPVFTVFSNFFYFLFLLRDQSLYIGKNQCYTHIYDCVETVYE